MRILLVHNYYGSSSPSGENVVFEAERDLLRTHGHMVETFTRHSDTIRACGLLGKIIGAFSVLGNPFVAFSLAKKCRTFKPDIIHFHNTFPLISLFSVRIASKYAPVVMTLHNYRLVCAAGVPMRDGQVCTLCLDQRSIVEGLRFRCYRKSFIATFPLVLSIAIYRIPLPRWVSRFIVFSEFQREKMGGAGLPLSKVSIKPNFIKEVDCCNADTIRTNQLLYVGRLSDEKGIRTLIKAWRLVQEKFKHSFISNCDKNKCRLVVVGDGEARKDYENLSNGLSIEFVGSKLNSEVRYYLSKAKGCILPSECYEGMPLTILEALSVGTPCVVSDLGALPSFVKDGQTGFVFKAGDAEDLARTIVKLLQMSEMSSHVMRKAAYLDYLSRFTPEKNYHQLMTIYKDVRR